MPINRYFTNQNFTKEKMISLDGTEFLHLVKVLRSKKGDLLELINGKGNLAAARVVELKKKEAVCELLEISHLPPPLSELILAQALPRLNRLDFILEKGTELGMTQIWLFPGELSEKKSVTEQQKIRMEHLMIAAIKQSGRLYLPKLVFHPPLSKWKSFPENSYFGDLDPMAPPLIKIRQRGDCTMFIGPESGFTDKEAELLCSAGVKGVNLHENTLRTDTAALVALTLASQG